MHALQDQDRLALVLFDSFVPCQVAKPNEAIIENRAPEEISAENGSMLFFFAFLGRMFFHEGEC